MLRRKLIVSSLVIEEWCFWIKRLGCKVYLHPKVSRCRIAPILADILPYYVMQKYVSYRTMKYGFSWRLLMVRSGLLTFFSGWLCRTENQCNFRIKFSGKQIPCQLSRHTNSQEFCRVFAQLRSRSLIGCERFQHKFLETNISIQLEYFLRVTCLNYY